MGNREALLAAADRCLRSHGYSATTARDLATEAGTSLAAIGYHFGSKEALLNEALKIAFDGWLDRLGSVALAAYGRPFDEALGELVTAIEEAIASDRMLLAAFFDATAQAARVEPLRRQLAAQYKATRQTIVEFVTAATADHPVGADTASALASLLIALIDGLGVQHVLDPGTTPSPAAVASTAQLLRHSRPARVTDRRTRTALDSDS